MENKTTMKKNLALATLTGLDNSGLMASQNYLFGSGLTRKEYQVYLVIQYLIHVSRSSPFTFVDLSLIHIKRNLDFRGLRYSFNSIRYYIRKLLKKGILQRRTYYRTKSYYGRTGEKEKRIIKTSSYRFNYLL